MAARKTVRGKTAARAVGAKAKVKAKKAERSPKAAARPRRARATEEPAADAPPAGPRPLWSGTVTFALVSVPVDLYPATRDSAVRLNLLAPDGTPLESRWFCPEEGREVPWEEIARADESEEGLVVLTEEEVESAAPRRSRDIEITSFVPVAEITPPMVERACVLTPTSGSTKPYRLLARALEDAGRAGIAQFVLRRRERLAAVLAHDGILWAVTLRFRGEVRTAEEVGLPAKASGGGAEVKVFGAALRALAKKPWSTEELRDPEQEGLRELIEKKSRRRGEVIEVEDAEEEEEEGEAGAEDAPELFDVIRDRLRASGSTTRRRAASGAGRARAKRAGRAS